MTSKGISDTDIWVKMNGALKKAAVEKGYQLTRLPGRGRSNVWEVRKAGRLMKASFRTTTNRWIAFPPLDHGARFKTLEDVELVFVAAVDDPETPRHIEIYEFLADDVRQQFNAAYAARTADGHTLPDNFGMWVSLDRDDRGIARSAGSGLADKHKPIAVYPIATPVEADVSAEGAKPDTGPNTNRDDRQPTTIAKILEAAREQISMIAGVRPDAVKLDLKIEY